MMSPNPSREERELVESIDMDQLSHDLDPLLTAPTIPRKKMRLNPTTGRMVPVGGNTDVARAFRLLDMSCAKNKVRNDFNRQRFHERGGLKRKRLGRERWRKKFGEGFKAIVLRVKHLRRQGW
jgi:small subunit ribosomal protein MRP21